MFAPVIGQRAQGGTHGLRGEVGRLAFGGEQEEAAVLHDELQARDALAGAPADPEITILERVTTRTQTSSATGTPSRSTS